MMVPDFVNLRGVWGVGGHAQGLLEHSDYFPMGGTSDFWPLVASHSISALYYQFTSTLARRHYWRLFLLHSDRTSWVNPAPIRDTAPTECLCQWLTAATTAASYTEKSAETHSWPSSFVFISMTIVT